MAIVFLVAGCTHGVPPASATPSPPPFDAEAGKSWQLTRAEEFVGNALDITSMSPCNPWSASIDEAGCGVSFNEGREAFSPAAVTVGGGVATLKAEPMTSTMESSGCYSVTRNPTSTCDYRSGQLEGAPAPGRVGAVPKAAGEYPWAFTYGYIETRWKMPAHAPGFFPAFWMVDTDGQAGDDPSTRNYDYHWEIDFEVPGTPGWPAGGPSHSAHWMASPVYMSYHYHDKFRGSENGRDSSYRVNYDNSDAARGFPTLDPRMNGNCRGGHFDYSGDWHTFAIDWQPTHIRWWIDGQMCGSYEDPSAATIPGPTTQMFPIIWIGVDQGWNRSLSANKDSSCVLDSRLQPCNLTGSSGESHELLVDYVRLWQQK
jgi:hypothetical protein